MLNVFAVMPPRLGGLVFAVILAAVGVSWVPAFALDPLRDVAEERGAPVDSAGESGAWSGSAPESGHYKKLGDPETGVTFIDLTPQVPPLIVAIQEGDEAEAARLIREGADVGATDDELGRTPLHWAARKNAAETAKVLIENGADVNAKSKNGDTHFLKRLSRERDFSEGQTPLHDAAKFNAADVLKLLIENGAEVGREDDGDGLTPLHDAARHDSLDAARLLLENGAEVDATADDIGKLEAYVTPLHVAAQNDSANVAELLIENGAEVNAHKPLIFEAASDMSVLDYAAKANALAVAKLLIENGAEVNIEHGDDEYETDGEGNHPLHWAASSGSANMVKLLLDHGAEIDARNNAGETPFHWATIMKDAPDVMRLLIERGADADAKSDGEFTLTASRGVMGQTPLHIAAKHNSARAAALLIELGAEVNNADAEDDRGAGKITPLHLAARKNAADAAKVLIENGADVNAKDERDATPLDISIYEQTVTRDEQAEMQSLLRQHGGNCSIAC